MKRRIKGLATGILTLIMVAGMLVGCGEAENVESTGSEIVSEQIASGEEANSEGTSEISSQTSESSQPVTSETPSELPTVETEEKTPFELHGAISVSGTNLVDCNGENFQLCGVSTHGLGWFPEYVNKDSFQSLRDDFGANVVRLAMYTAEGAGYCTGGNRDTLKGVVENGVQYATDLGMYVIVDWHVLHDLDPNVYKSDAIAFFDDISKKYSEQDNVIYEICNEPNGGTTWSQVKGYAEEVIPVIRANDPNAIIIVGTPTWSQDVDIAAGDPITGYDNIMYAVHFYADTHRDSLRDKTERAIQAGMPIFVTEFSICDASGNGTNNISEADKWIAFLDKNNISFAAWNLSNKAESSSLIQSGCAKKFGWTYDELSESGKWLVGVLNTHSDQGSGLLRGAAPVASTGSTSQQENPQLVVQPAAQLAEGGNGSLNATASQTNSWESGSKKCAQYSLSITNGGSSSVSSWKVELDFGQSVSIDQIWNCKGSVDGNKIIITPETYNQSISSNATISDVGLIISSSGEIGTPTLTLK